MSQSARTALSDANEVTVVLYGDCPNNKVVYIETQAKKDDQVLCHLSIKTKALLTRESLKVQGQSYTEILNNNYSCGSFKINSNCERLQNHLKAEVSRAKMKLKKLNRNGTKQQRGKFYKGWKRLAILNSDIVTADQLQDTVRSLETKNNNLKKSNCHLKNQDKIWLTSIPT